ncbi:MAG: serine/threonine-protein kinase, partial [Pseudomonadota bacterium]
MEDNTKTSQSDDPLIGTLLGNFCIEEQIAKGGMGLIYRAVHSVIGRRAAIKVLTEKYSNDRTMIKRLHREARAVNRVGHPNIVDIFDFGRTTDDREYFVMEYLDGESLAHVLEKNATLNWDFCSQLLTQILGALAAAHELGIVHRDVKPENIMVVPQEDGTIIAKILDFGIAKSVGVGPDGEHLTQAGSVMGTPEYIAPEQIRGKKVDGRADLYAVGIILFELLTGRRPFEGDTVIQTLLAHLKQEPPIAEPPKNLGIPDHVPMVIQKALAKDPEGRYPDAISFAKALGLETSNAISKDNTRAIPQRFWEMQSGESKLDLAEPGAFTAPRGTFDGSSKITDPTSTLPYQQKIATVFSRSGMR